MSYEASHEKCSEISPKFLSGVQKIPQNSRLISWKISLQKIKILRRASADDAQGEEFGGHRKPQIFVRKTEETADWGLSPYVSQVKRGPNCIQWGSEGAISLIGPTPAPAKMQAAQGPVMSSMDVHAPPDNLNQPEMPYLTSPNCKVSCLDLQKPWPSTE